MSTVPAFDAPTPQPEPKRDRYGRYLLPDPTGSKELPWTRATTFAKSVADTFGLTQWEMRMVVAGIGMRRDLYALAAATPIEDKDKLTRIAKDAKEAAQAGAGANLGTALHSFTEANDRGETVTAPPPWDADLAAYRDALTAAGVVAVPSWIERIVVVPELKVAGTLDRIVRLADGRLVIADVKTGKDLSYGWGEIAIQLALYANAPVMWNAHTDAYEPMPALDRTSALVMHLPAGKGVCTLWDVDITAGWEAAQLCQQVRAWRARKGLASRHEQVAGQLAIDIATTETAAAPAAGTPAGATLSALRHAAAVGELTRHIPRACTVADLEALWARGVEAGTWTPAHTAQAAARKKALLVEQSS